MTVRLRAVAVLVAGFVSGSGGGPLWAQRPVEGVAIGKENRTIAITASDSVLALADVATVHVGFVVYAADHDAAYAAGSASSNAVMQAIRGLGVAAEAIESESQNLGEVQPYQSNTLPEAERARRRWMLSQSWTVRTTPEDAPRVQDAAVKAGANQGGGIDWSLQDENALAAQAAGKALQRARAVAQEMARGLNVKLGALLFASNETQAAPVRPMPPMLRQEMKAAAAPRPLAINPRRIERTATVYAVFSIE